MRKRFDPLALGSELEVDADRCSRVAGDDGVGERPDLAFGAAGDPLACRERLGSRAPRRVGETTVA